MGVSWQAEVLIDGAAEGEVLRLDAPISFWGGVNPVDGGIVLSGHPQLGDSIAGKILVVPSLIGSSSSSAIMLELIHAGMAPAALILGETDAILPIGVVVARQMAWQTIPVLTLPDPPFRSGDLLRVAPGGSIERISEHQ